MKRTTSKAKAALSAALSITFIGLNAFAQTSVTTTGGTPNTIPLFTDNVSIGSSIMYQSGANVGIGTAYPTAKLDVEGGGILIGGLPPLSPGAGFSLSSTEGHWTSLFSSLNTSNWNGIVQAGDQGVIFSGSGIGTGAFVIAPWANGQPGLRVTAGGNVGIGTPFPAAPLEINGSMKLSSGSGASITFPDNTVQSTAWNGTTFGGDYAESVDVQGLRSTYEPGDLLVLDRDHPGQFLKSNKPFSRLVADVYSTKPGLTGHRHSIKGITANTEVPMAMVGIVPTKVSAENGPIEVGDLLVTSSLKGYAMSAGNGVIPTGTVIGKSMGTLKTGTGIVEVLISLQ